MTPLAAETTDEPGIEEQAVAVDRRWGLVASAVAGRKVAVALDDVGLAYTDGETVFLPRSEQPQLETVVAQAALIAAGSLDAWVMARLVGRATTARRYVTLELARALADAAVPVPRTTRPALSVWTGPVPASARGSYELASRGTGVPEAPASLGSIRPRKVLAGDGTPGGFLSGMTRRPVDGRQKEVPVDELGDDDDSEESKILKLFSSPFQFENPIFKLLRNQLGMGRRAKTDGDDGGMELPTAGSSAARRVGTNAQLATAPPGMSLGVSEHDAGEASYPEWDCVRKAYRPDWCAVGEFFPAEADPDGAFNPTPDFALRRRLASLGLAYARHRHQPDGDALDIGSLVEFAVSRAMGETPDEHVYQARLKTAHDLGVVVLLDASGSTAQRANGTPVWNQHRQLAANLIGTLEQVGDRVAAYGFNSRGRRHVRFLAVKDFDHRFDAVAVRRLASLQPSGFTRLGAAIRHATHVAAEQAGTANRLVVVVSDGFPYDDGYQGRYAEQDTKRALEEAGAHGVGCVCISIASDAQSDALARLWGAATHVQLGDASELSLHVVPMVQAALKVARGTRDIHANRSRRARAS